MCFEQLMHFKWNAQRCGFAALCRRGLFLLACVILTACTGGAAPVSKEGPSLEKPVSMYGDYLSARHAGAVGDYSVAADYFERVLTADPQNQGILERTFLLALSDGQIDRARELADQIIKADPENRLARIVTCFTEMKRGNFAAAHIEIKRASGGAFSQLLNGLIEAWVFAGLGRYDDALTSAGTLAEHASFDLFRHYHTALINIAAGRMEAADTAFKQAIKTGGDANIRVVEAYGVFLERQGRNGEARALYDKFEESASGNALTAAARARLSQNVVPPSFIPFPAAGAAEVLYGVASALSQDNGVDISVIYLRLALYLYEDFRVAHILMANLFEKDRRYEEAINAYEKVSEESPFYKEAHIQIAMNLSRLERDKEAVSKLRSLSEDIPNDLEIVTALAELERVQENYSEANQHYTQALSLAGADTNDWSLYYSRGITFERLGRWPEAEKDFLHALELAPDNPLVLNYLGYSWIEQGMHLERAVDMVRKAVELRPNDGYIVDSLGWAHYRLGNFAEAVKHLERAVELKPEDPIINDHLGDAYWKVGRQFEARFQWQKALTFKPESKEIPLIKQKLEQGLDAMQKMPRQEAGRE
jgi:Flp pilus assembly protein TadD